MSPTIRRLSARSTSSSTSRSSSRMATRVSRWPPLMRISRFTESYPAHHPPVVGPIHHLLVDRADNRRMVGDIYLGRVEAVLPGIQAAFLDIGHEKSAFLHASDLLEPDEDDDEPDESDDQPEDPAAVEAEPPAGEAGLLGERDKGRRGNGGDGQRQPPRQREVSSRRQVPDIAEILKKGQALPVQVTKEPISTKGCRVTAQIS